MALHYSVLAILVLLSFAYNAYATSGVGIITTVAGSGNSGFGGDGGLATSADLDFPKGVHVDAAGNIYIADADNNRVRKVDTYGMITTIAGTGVGNYNGDYMAATAADLNYPLGVNSDTLGNIFIADASNHRIRKIDVTGMITTFAGTGINGYSGDNIAAINAYLHFPNSISFDKAGNTYICDQYNNRIRKVDASGIITTVAGTGVSGFGGDNGLATEAMLYSPYEVSLDSAGNIYIADSPNFRIRKVDIYGIITTVAGIGSYGFSGDGGLATSAAIAAYGMTPDPFGNLYIADMGNHRIRKVDANGIITTVAGNGMGYFSGDGGAAADADMTSPINVASDSSGNIYIADASQGRIRKVTFTAPPTVMPTLKPTARSTSAKPTKATSTKTPSFRPTNKPTKKKTAAPSRRPTKKPTKKPTK